MPDAKPVLHLAKLIVLIPGLAVFPEILHEVFSSAGSQSSVESGWPTGLTRIALLFVFAFELYLAYRAARAGRPLIAASNSAFAMAAILAVQYSPLVFSLTQTAKVELFSDRYDRCAKAAIE